MTLAENLSEAGFKAAWLARRTYALSPGWHLRAQLAADQEHPMGSTLRCPAGATLPLAVKMTQNDGSAFTGEYRLFASTGSEPVAVVKGEAAQFTLTAPAAGEAARWYFVRVHGGSDNRSVAYLAPVWIEAAP